MAVEPDFQPRFVVRKGSIEGPWMVWDRETHRPAKTKEGWAAGLTEERAHKLRESLTRSYIGLSDDPIG